MAGTNGNLRAEEVQMDHANLWLSQINPEWLEQAKAGLNAAYPGYCGASEEIQTKLLLDHFIFTDAPRCLRGSLPDIAGQNVLQGDYFVQIEEAFDASKPFKERYVDGHNPGRVLKLHLSDGKRSVIALEHNFIPDLSNKLSRGAKAILEGPIKVERGALLLVPGNISVIGGEVYELNAQMQALSQAVMQQPVGRRGPSPTLQQYMENQVHTLVQATGAAAVVGANGGAGGVLEGGRPVQPVSPELQQQQQAPHQRMPDSPRQLQQQQAPPPPAGNANASGVFMPSHQHQQFIPAIQQQQHGSISFGSGNVPPVGGSQQQQPGPVLIPPAANGNHPRPFPPLPLPPATVAERASSGEGWSSDSDDEEDEDDYGNDQPGAAGAAAAPAGQLQQQPPQEVIEILEEEDDDETQPFQEEEEEDNHEQLLNGLPQPSNNNTMVNRTRVVDSPGH
ncbi:hypothetical protein Ndes2526B_g01855 [Nannochloris sp. 'desiccata']|nr:hypothetical protein KSW81_005667 [Chlorella desiccata (nom. nud.)]KAH7623426.1 putative RecQ-mediated genome instability protein 1 [Chlorella desiccata (nom. nud.)]